MINVSKNVTTSSATRAASFFALSCAIAFAFDVQNVQAQEDKREDPLWSKVFGEGMRAWAESDYEVALENLYQAYAIKPTAYNLGLIVRSHDFLGQCHAALKQRKEYKALYGERDQPVLQNCAAVGSLTVTCPEGYKKLEVWLNGHKAGYCGDVLTAVAGKVEVSVPHVQYVVDVEVDESRALVHEVALRVEEKRPHVSKLLGTADRYTVFMTPDGLYQIWVLSDEALLEPYEGSFCMRQDGEKGGSDVKASCKPLTKKQRDELEKVAPRVLLLPE